jgi:hypothetical protein
MMSMTVTMHPIWQTGAVILVLAIAAALALQLLVHQALPAPIRQEHTLLGGAIFSVIGTTYAVLLAFMASTAWGQYSAAEDLARHEANLIASFHAASQGVADPAGAGLRSDARAYLDHIIDAEWPAQIAGHPVPATEALLTRLQQRLLTLPEADRAKLQGMFDEITDARRDRRLATHGTIPDLVWIVLLSGGVLVVAFSFVLGAPTQGLHLVMTGALVASGVLVLLLIIGLSSPFHGAVTIAPDAYRAVRAEMG